MKKGISSYSYNRLLSEKKYTLFDAIKNAQKTGFEVIEFSDFTPPDGKSLEDFAGELSKACKSAGIGVCNYATHADFLYGSDGDLDAEVKRLKGRVDIAKILDSPLMRHDACWGLKDTSRARSWHDVIKIIAPAIREVTEYAASLNIRTMTENHGYFLQDSTRMEELVRTVHHPNYGLLVDMGNFMCADESSIKALATVMPYAFHVHVKDFLYKDGTEPRPDDS